MIKKTYFLLFVISAFFITGCTSQYLVEIPEDFKIVAISGGVNPAAPLYKVEINSEGEGIYFKMPSENRARGLFIEMNRFKLEKPALQYLYASIKDNKFFSLEGEYVADDVLDGSFAELTITENNRSHTVRTQNVAVDRFDKIMIALNIATPQEVKVVYNEILW